MANFKYLRAYNAYCEECELNHKNPKVLLGLDHHGVMIFFYTVKVRQNNYFV